MDILFRQFKENTRKLFKNYYINNNESTAMVISIVQTLAIQAQTLRFIIKKDQISVTVSNGPLVWFHANRVRINELFN